jgi:HEAT repeat protein
MLKKLPLFFVVFLLCLLPVFAQETSTKAWQILDQGLADKNPVKRKDAVIALGLAGASNEVFTRLSNALNDKDVDVQVATCATLGSLKNKRAIELLTATVKSEIPEVAYAAATGLFQLGQPLGREILIDVLQGEKKNTSNYLTTQKRGVIQMLQNRPAMMRMALKEGIGMLPIPGAGFGAASLEAILKDAGMSGRALVATMLANEKDAASLQALRDSLDDKSWSVRAAAVHALAVRNRPEVLNEIIPLMEDKSDAVKFRAAAAALRLSTIGKAKSSKKLKSKK